MGLSVGVLPLLACLRPAATAPSATCKCGLLPYVSTFACATTLPAALQISPTHLRGTLGSINQLMICVGILAALLVRQ